MLVAVLWVGGGATLAFMAIATLRMNDPLRVAQFAHQAGKIGERLYTRPRCWSCCSGSA